MLIHLISWVEELENVCISRYSKKFGNYQNICNFKYRKAFWVFWKYKNVDSKHTQIDSKNFK